MSSGGVRFLVAPLREEEEIPTFLNKKHRDDFLLLHHDNVPVLRRMVGSTTVSQREKYFMIFSRHEDVIGMRNILPLVGGVEGLNPARFEGMLIRACINNHMELLHYYFEELGFKVHEPFHDCEYIAHYMCACKGSEAIRYIFGKGADPNIMYRERHPLIEIISFCGEAVTLNEFILAGADISVRYNRNGKDVSLYEFAIYHNSPSVAAVLFNLGMAEISGETFNNVHIRNGLSNVLVLFRVNQEVNKGDDDEKKSGLREKGADDRYLKFLFAKNPTIQSVLINCLRVHFLVMNNEECRKYIATDEIRKLFWWIYWNRVPT